MNGRGMPVIGKDAVTTPMLMSACTVIILVTPVASRHAVASGAFIAALYPRHARKKKSAIMAVQPMKPSSSPAMAKMKSVWASGR